MAGPVRRERRRAPVNPLGVVLDVSALVEYARNDSRALPLGELLGEVGDDVDVPVIIGWLTLGEAQRVLGDDHVAVGRLEGFVAKHGVRLADSEMVKAVEAISAAVGVTHGLAHAIILASVGRRELATYAAGTLAAAGVDMARVLDLDEMFPPE